MPIQGSASGNCSPREQLLSVLKLFCVMVHFVYFLKRNVQLNNNPQLSSNEKTPDSIPNTLNEQYEHKQAVSSRPKYACTAG